MNLRFPCHSSSIHKMKQLRIISAKSLWHLTKADNNDPGLFCARRCRLDVDAFPIMCDPDWQTPMEMIFFQLLHDDDDENDDDEKFHMTF